MSLSIAERNRLENAEEVIRRLAKLIEGGGSVNQLNRLLVLASGTVEKLTKQVEELEATSQTILELVRRLQ